MKNLEHLPKKFCFKLDEIGKRWIRETFGTGYYDDCKYESDFFNYPNYQDFKGFKKGFHLSSIGQMKGYTLISTDQLFPQPQIPTIEKGVMMLVWGDSESDAKEREVMFFDGKYYYARSIVTTDCIRYKHAKPIPQIPEYTLEELKQIIGHEFKIK